MGVDKAGQRVRQMFAQIAWRYDFLNHLLSLGMDYRWRQEAVRRAPPVPGLPILDICTGTADLALAYWRAGRASVPVVGVDFCRPMLQGALEKCRRLGAAGKKKFFCPAESFSFWSKARPVPASAIYLIEADASALPFDSHLFQIVSVAFGLRNIQNPELALREMVRVCGTGGRVVILEFSMPRPFLLRSMYRWYFRWVLPRIGQALVPNQLEAYHYLPASVEEFPPANYWTERMNAVGLHHVRAEPLTFGIATLYVGKKLP